MRRATFKSPGINVKRSISIHALREESDAFSCVSRHGDGISIHALREESDDINPKEANVAKHFNPRSP